MIDVILNGIEQILLMTSAALENLEKKAGEVLEMSDPEAAMLQIKFLNDQLRKENEALSKVIPIMANVTLNRNMMKMVIHSRHTERLDNLMRLFGVCIRKVRAVSELLDTKMADIAFERGIAVEDFRS